MKNLYTALFASLFIFATTHTAENILSRVSSTETLDGLELTPLIDQNVRSTTPELTISFIQIHRQHAMRQLELNRLQSNILVNDDEYTPPYTCPACIINLAAYLIQQTKRCTTSTCDYCKNCYIHTCDPICIFITGHNSNTVNNASMFNPIRVTNDSCCGKCATCLEKNCTSLEANLAVCGKFCKYTFCCLWLEQCSHQDEN